MSVSICWKPVSKISKTINGQSSVVDALRDAGFLLPYRFDYKDLAVLKGMAASTKSHFGKEPNPYQQIIDAIEKHETIQVYTEY